MRTTLQIRNGEANAIPRGADIDAGSRQTRRIIRRAEEACLVLIIIVNFTLIETVVAPGENVQPHCQEFLRNEWRNTETTGAIFRVCDGKIDLLFGDEAVQIFCDNATATRGENIANEKDVHVLGTKGGEALPARASGLA